MLGVPLLRKSSATEAAGKRVDITSAKTDGALDPRQAVISLRIERIQRPRVHLTVLADATSHNSARDARGERVADYSTPRALRYAEGVLRSVGRSPGLGVVDAEGGGDEVLDEADVGASRDRDAVCDEETLGDGDGRAGPGALDDTRHEHVPVEEGVVAVEGHNGVGLAALVQLGGGGGGLGLRGSGGGRVIETPCEPGVGAVVRDAAIERGGIFDAEATVAMRHALENGLVEDLDLPVKAPDEDLIGTEHARSKVGRDRGREGEGDARKGAEDGRGTHDC